MSKLFRIAVGDMPTDLLSKYLDDVKAMMKADGSFGSGDWIIPSFNAGNSIEIIEPNANVNLNINLNDPDEYKLSDILAVLRNARLVPNVSMVKADKGEVDEKN
jgi:hypothetical protein